MGIVGILLLVIHIIICIVVYLLMRAGILKSTRMIMPLVCMVPAAGVAALLVLEIRSRGKQEILEEVGIEKLKINDEIHRSILMDEDPVEDRIVPLEEALRLFEEGTALMKKCSAMLDRAEQKIVKLTAGPDGKAEERPLDGEG